MPGSVASGTPYTKQLETLYSSECSLNTRGLGAIVSAYITRIDSLKWRSRVYRLQLENCPKYLHLITIKLSHGLEQANGTYSVYLKKKDERIVLSIK
jgi:hypothetical protein